MFVFSTGRACNHIKTDKVQMGEHASCLNVLFCFYFLLLLTENVQTEYELSKLFISIRLLKQRKKTVMLALVVRHTGYALLTWNRKVHWV